MLTIKLVAIDLALYFEWHQIFHQIPNIEIIDGDILRQDGDAIVSPANSFGYMDGGLDLKYSQHFGWELEKTVRKKLESHHFGELPVGNALIVDTGDTKIPYLISAPTMRVPSNVSHTVNAYLAFKAVLQAVILFNRKSSKRIGTILCPGLCTGEGKMAPKQCAQQMAKAYQVCMADGMITHGGLSAASKDHMQMLGYDIF